MKRHIVYMSMLLIPVLSHLKIDTNFHDYIWTNYQQFGGNMDAAGKGYATLSSSDHTPIYWHKGYVHYLDKTKKFKEIITLTSIINDTFKDDPDLQLILINALKKDKQDIAAKKQLVHAYNAFPLHTHIVFETASMYIDQKELSNALQIIDKLLNNVSPQSNFFIFHFIKAQLYVQLKQLDKALESVKKSLEMHNTFDQGWLMRAVIEEELGQVNNAIAGYTQFLSLTEQPNQQIAQHLMQLSLKQKLVQSQTSLEKTDSVEKAMRLYQEQKYTQALEATETYLTHHPQNVQARLLKIQLLSDMKQFNRAITQVQAWIYENPSDELWFEALHVLAYNGAQASHITQVFQSIHTQYPDNKWAILYLADLYLRTKSNQKAITLLEKSTQVIQDKDLLTKILFQLGLLYFEKQEYAAMQKTLEKGLNLHTNFIPLMNLLAYYYATKGHNIPKAEELMTTILTHNKTNPHLLDTHALILYKKKDYAQALSLLHQLHAQVPQDATIAIHLAQTQYKLNNTPDAHTTLRNAHAMAKSPYEKNKIAVLTKKWSSQ